MTSTTSRQATWAASSSSSTEDSSSDDVIDGSPIASETRPEMSATSVIEDVKSEIR